MVEEKVKKESGWFTQQRVTNVSNAITDIHLVIYWIYMSFFYGYDNDIP